MPQHSQSFTSNLLLRSLTEEQFARIQPDLNRVDLQTGDLLFQRDTPIQHVYFLEGGVGSLTAADEGDQEIEVGLFGYEGFSGIPVVAGVDQSPLQSLIQVGPCTALRIESAALLAACESQADLRTVFLRYAHVLSIQCAHTAVANANFALPERLARWLLMCHDRVEGDEIRLTHHYMSVMLGVRRSGVTVTLHTLEAAGGIRSTRGMVTVLNRSRLEEAAGLSYGRAEAEYSRVIAPFGKSVAA